MYGEIMSQMWCFLVLSMILGLCSSSAPIDNKYSYQKLGDNDPMPQENCEYQYRIDTPLYCNYYVSFGTPTQGQKRVMYRRYWKLPNSSNPREFEIVFPGVGNNWKINYITVKDSKNSLYVWYDDFKVIEGGIGDGHVKLVITSDEPVPPKYYVAIYAIPKFSGRLKGDCGLWASKMTSFGCTY